METTVTTARASLLTSFSRHRWPGGERGREELHTRMMRCVWEGQSQVPVFLGVAGRLCGWWWQLVKSVTTVRVPLIQTEHGQVRPQCTGHCTVHTPPLYSVYMTTLLLSPQYILICTPQHSSSPDLLWRPGELPGCLGEVRGYEGRETERLSWCWRAAVLVVAPGGSQCSQSGGGQVVPGLWGRKYTPLTPANN